MARRKQQPKTFDVITGGVNHLSRCESRLGKLMFGRLVTQAVVIRAALGALADMSDDEFVASVRNQLKIEFRHRGFEDVDQPEAGDAA